MKKKNRSEVSAIREQFPKWITGDNLEAYELPNWEESFASEDKRQELAKLCIDLGIDPQFIKLASISNKDELRDECIGLHGAAVNSLNALKGSILGNEVWQNIAK